MALLKTQQWYIRTDAGANALNGGGFDPVTGAGMVNYADAASPLVTSTTGTCAVAAADHLIDASANFPTDIVGNILRSSARAGGTAAALGYFSILTRVSATELILDRALAVTSDVTALTYRIGGAHATLVNYASSAVNGAPAVLVPGTPLAPGHTINLRGSGSDDGSADYTSNGGSWTFPDGDRVSGAITLLGYNGRPCYANAGLLLQDLTEWRIRKVKFLPTGASGTGSMVSCVDSAFHLCGAAFEDVYLDQNGQDVGLCNTAFSTVRCWLKNTGSTTAGTSSSVKTLQGAAGVIGCRFQDQRGPSLTIAYTSLFVHNLITGGHGTTGAIIVADPASHPPFFGKTIWNNTIDSCVGPGIQLGFVGNICMSNVQNNLISNCTTYGIDAPNNDNVAGTAINNNAFYNNTTAETHFLTVGNSLGINNVTLSGSPYVGSGNYGLNTTSGAGAACKDAGFPGVFPGAAGTGLMDIGGVQGAAVATAITLSGPSVGVIGTASTNFTVGANGAITGTVTVTPTSSAGTGTFTPTTVQISSGTPTATFTYTPSSGGARNINGTNDGSLSAPSNVLFTVGVAVVTGTILTATPANIVSGGKTIILTLTDDTWITAGAAFNAERQAIINGLDSNKSGITGWNAEVRDKEVVGAVVRSSNTAVTITLTAEAAYAITESETITVTIPASALTNNIAMTATPTFTLTAGGGISEGMGISAGSGISDGSGISPVTGISL